MDEMTRWQRIVDRFLRSEGLSSGAVTAIELVALIVLGIIAIKIIVYLTRRAMMKSTLDASLYKFVLNGVKVVLYITLVTMGLSILGVSPTTIKHICHIIVFFRDNEAVFKGRLYRCWRGQRQGGAYRSVPDDAQDI